MIARLIPDVDLDRYIGQTESHLAEADPSLLSSLNGKPYKGEALRYILLTQYPILLQDRETTDDILFTRFFWHNVARGVIQSIEPDSLLFLGDMDDILGAPSRFFGSDDLDDLYERAENYITSWESRNRQR